MRLWNQAMALEGNHDSDNWIDPRQLGHLEESVLRERFKETGDLYSQIKRIFG
jgi:signal-transduction protein with cAMP-binding, CBS, and nucleotidyltransferase domain